MTDIFFAVGGTLVIAMPAILFTIYWLWADDWRHQ